MSLNSAGTNVTDVTGTGNLGNAMIERYMVSKLLTLADRETVFYKLGNKVSIPKGESKTITFTRWERLQTPRVALTEGVTPAAGNTLNVSRVIATAEQWGSYVTLSDVAEMTLRFQPFQRAVELMGLQAAETLDREILRVLLAGTNVYYPNSKTSRASLTSGDVVDDVLQRKIRAQLKHNGAPGYSGATSSRRTFIGVTDAFVMQDLMKDTTFIEAAKFQNIQPLTSGEMGEWLGVRWQESNNIPQWERQALGETVDFAGVLTSGETNMVNGTYIVAVTAYDNSGYERIFQTTDFATGHTGTTSADVISVVLPSLAPSEDSGTLNAYNTHGYDAGARAYNIYCSSAGGDITTLKLQASNLPGGTYHICAATTLTAATSITYNTSGAAAPAQAPASTVGKVHNFFIFGNEWFSVAEIEGVKTMMTPAGAQKGDELAQRRSVGWKFFCKAIITNQNFGIRGECVSNFDS